MRQRGKGIVKFFVKTENIEKGGAGNAGHNQGAGNEDSGGEGQNDLCPLGGGVENSGFGKERQTNNCRNTGKDPECFLEFSLQRPELFLHDEGNRKERHAQEQRADRINVFGKKAFDEEGCQSQPQKIASDQAEQKKEGFLFLCAFFGKKGVDRIEHFVKKAHKEGNRSSRNPRHTAAKGHEKSADEFKHFQMFSFSMIFLKNPVGKNDGRTGYPILKSKT